MKLRHRLALTFAALSSLSVAVAFSITLGVFRHAQLRQLDQALHELAEHEAAETMQLGGQHLYIHQADPARGTDIEHLVKFGALYRADGTLLDKTNTFGPGAPSLSDLPTQRVGGFDLLYNGRSLRAVIVAEFPPNQPKLLLLLAAPRGDLDTDTTYLLEVMAAVLAGVVLFSVLLGTWFGESMTRGLVAIATVAQRVSLGELTARVPLNPSPTSEIRQLGADLNQMIDRLGELVAAERRFVSHAAHELRSPLTALRGELELALRRPRENEHYKTAIQEALDDTNRLIVLAEDLLALARVSLQTKNQSVASSFSLRSVIDEAIRASFIQSTSNRNLQIDLPEIELLGRHPDLIRMIRNLLDNAVAHSPEGCSVRIRIDDQKAAPETVAILIEDDGDGVPEELRARIFDPFFRGETERSHSGAGLGLAIAREIARAHGGDITLSNPSRPTQFRATFRIAP